MMQILVIDRFMYYYIIIIIIFNSDDCQNYNQKIEIQFQ